MASNSLLSVCVFFLAGWFIFTKLSIVSAAVVCTPACGKNFTCMIDAYTQKPVCQCIFPLPATNTFCQNTTVPETTVCSAISLESGFMLPIFYLGTYSFAGFFGERPYYVRQIFGENYFIIFSPLAQAWSLQSANLVFLLIFNQALYPELIGGTWNRYSNEIGWYPDQSIFLYCQNCSNSICGATMFCDGSRTCACPTNLTNIEGKSCALVQPVVCPRVRVTAIFKNVPADSSPYQDFMFVFNRTLNGWPFYVDFTRSVVLTFDISEKSWLVAINESLTSYYLRAKSQSYLVENIPDDSIQGVLGFKNNDSVVLTQTYSKVRCDLCYPGSCPDSFACVTYLNQTTDCLCPKYFVLSDDSSMCIPLVNPCEGFGIFYEGHLTSYLGIIMEGEWQDFHPVYSIDGLGFLYYVSVLKKWILSSQRHTLSFGVLEKIDSDVLSPDLFPSNSSKYQFSCWVCQDCFGGECIFNQTGYSCRCFDGFDFNGTHCVPQEFKEACKEVEVWTPSNIFNGIYIKEETPYHGLPYYYLNISESLSAYIYSFLEESGSRNWGISNSLLDLSPDFYALSNSSYPDLIASKWLRVNSVQNVTITCICPSVSSLNISYLNASAITLHWSPLADLSLPYSGVLVSVKDSQGVFLASRSLSVAQSSEVVGSLQPYSVFTAVVGFSMNNCSLTYTAGVSGRTPEAAPSDAPGGISVTAEARQVTVRWEAPARPNGVVSGYKVEWSEGAGSGPSTRRGVPMSAEVSGSPYVAGNLSVYTQYSFRVAGRTGAGWGPFSSPVNVSTLATVPGAAPGAVGVEALSSSSVNISWTRLDGKDANGIMLWYSIVYGAVGAGGAEVKVVATESWHVIERLLSSEAYVFKVAGVNHVGYGAYSSEALINMTLYFTTTTTTTTTVTTTTTTTTTSTTSTTTITIAAAASSSSASSGIVIGAVIGCVVVILVVLFFVARRAMQRPRVATIEDDTYLFINPSFQHFSNEFQEMKLSIEPEFVKVEEKVGEGQFGLVHRGRLTSVYPARTVAIKYLKLTAEAFEQEAFLQEAVRMKDLDHENVVKLLGVQHRVQPIFLVIEFLAKGDLRKYLLAGKSRINMATRVHMCVQVMSGLHYLQRMKYVHRDIAARNILISEENVLKIGDFGMARDIYQHQYYRVSSKGALPLRWMAPESVLTGQFTLASDIWMFGVTVWEIFSSGELPWPGVDNGDIIESLRQGKHMAIQSSWPQEVQAILLMTWVSDEETRTKSEDLLMHLKAYLKALLSRNDTEPIFYYSNLRSSKVKGIGDELKEEEEEDDAPTAPPPARHPSSSFPFGSPTNDASALDEETHL